MESQIDEMVRAWLHSEQLAIGHMRHPGQGMQIAGKAILEGPGNAVPGATGVAQLGIEPVELCSREFLQPDPAQPRHDVPVDHALVGIHRGRLNAIAHQRQPGRLDHGF